MVSSVFPVEVSGVAHFCFVSLSESLLSLGVVLFVLDPLLFVLLSPAVPVSFGSSGAALLSFSFV